MRVHVPLPWASMPWTLWTRSRCDSIGFSAILHLLGEQCTLVCNKSGIRTAAVSRWGTGCVGDTWFPITCWQPCTSYSWDTTQRQNAAHQPVLRAAWPAASVMPFVSSHIIKWSSFSPKYSWPCTGGEGREGLKGDNTRKTDSCCTTAAVRSVLCWVGKRVLLYHTRYLAQLYSSITENDTRSASELYICSVPLCFQQLQQDCNNSRKRGNAEGLE